MKQFSLKNLQIAHFILLIALVLLCTILRLLLDNEDALLKGLSLCSSLIGSMWGLLLVLNTLIKDKNEPDQKFLFSFYRSLLCNTRFLIVSDITFFTVALGLFAFMTFFQVVEFRTYESRVEVFLSSNKLELKEPGYQSMGIITPDKPLKVRLPVGKKRFSFESLSDNKGKDAKLIHLKPFKIGNTYIYQVNMH
jgi:hypothetical protein